MHLAAKAPRRRRPVSSTLGIAIPTMHHLHIARVIATVLLVALNLPAAAQSSEPVPADALDLMKGSKHMQAAERISPTLALEFALAYAKRSQWDPYFVYLRSAAFRSLPRAQFQLALALSSDACCSQRPVEAYAWASQLADADSNSLKDSLERQLTPDELRYAMDQASELRRRLASNDRTGWPQSSLCAKPQPSGAGHAICSYRCDPQPNYPVQARRAEATGVVELEFNLNERGSAGLIAVRKSSGISREHKLLDRASVEFVSSCLFPAKLVDTTRPYGVAYRWSLQ
jgi:TonB family protein